MNHFASFESSAPYGVLLVGFLCFRDWLSSMMSLEVHFSGFTQQNAVSLEEPFSSLLLFLQPEQQPPQLTPPQLCNKTRTFPLMMISSVVDFVGCRSDIGNCIHREYRNIF